MQLREQPDSFKSTNFQPSNYNLKRYPDVQTDSLKKAKTILISGVIIFLGVNIAIETVKFLGSMVSCGTKLSYNSEARSIITSQNKAQQGSYLENQAFSSTFNSLFLSLKDQSKNFKYSTNATPIAAFSYAIPLEDAAEKASFGVFQWSKNINYRLNSHVGGVFVVPAAKNETITKAILCKAKTLGTIKLQEPTLKNGVPTCGSDSLEISQP